MDKYKDIYERYLKANQTWRFIFVDLLNDLIGWIGAIDELINYCMEHQELMDIMFTPEHKADIIKDFKVWELSWIFQYKKVDRFSEDVKNHMNTQISWTISQIAFMRAGMIQELFRAWIIRDLCISEEKVFGTQEMLKDIVKWKERWKYKINKNALFLNDTHFGIGKDLQKYDKNDKSDIWGAVAVQLLHNFINIYGEDQLNTELNLDDSHKKMLFFNWKKEDIEDLRDTLIYWENKKLLKTINFKNWDTYINKQKWKYQPQDKADYALSLIAKYFTEYPFEEDVKDSDLQAIHIDNWKPLEISFWDSFRTGYIKTLNNRFEKKFINGGIFEMSKSTIRVKEMDNS
jgi:hypothetical protein